MSGNAPRAVNQAVQKRVKNGGPPETLWTSRHHRVRPEVGEDWGAASMRAAEEQSPPKKTGESGAVKTAGVPQGGTKSEPATQVTGKGRLGGKKGGRRKRRSRTPKTGSEKKALGYRKRETWASKEPVRRVVAEREKGTEKRISGRQNSRSEKDVAERERGTRKPDTWAAK